jgi:hypothetical protein
MSDERYRYAGKTTVNVADELYVRVASYGARQFPPLSPDRVVEKLIFEGLDRAALAQKETACTKPN